MNERALHGPARRGKRVAEEARRDLDDLRPLLDRTPDLHRLRGSEDGTRDRRQDAEDKDAHAHNLATLPGRASRHNMPWDNPCRTYTPRDVHRHRAFRGLVGERPHHLVVQAGELALPRGASLAVNGVCLTVTEANAGRAVMDLSAETVRRTTLGDLRPGDPVNLEPALRVGEELGAPPPRPRGHGGEGRLDRAAGEEVVVEIAFDPGSTSSSPTRDRWG